MKQSMKLAARILENLPVMSADVMQGWIENPWVLRNFLKGLLVPRDAVPLGELQDDSHKTKWRTVDNIIYFDVTSDGTTGKAWVERLENKGFYLDNFSKQILRGSFFRPTCGVTTQMAVLKGELFAKNQLYTENIRAYAWGNHKLIKPDVEVACLILEKFSHEELEEMGLSVIITMHDPIKDSVNNPYQLGSARYDNGCHLGAYVDMRVSDCGFAFAALQSSST